MFDLTGMTALVTGASGGIGSAIARSLAQQGARLALDRQDLVAGTVERLPGGGWCGGRRQGVGGEGGGWQAGR